MFTEDLKELINKLNEGKTANQICESLGLTRSELHYKLKILNSFGKLYRSNYYSTGEIVYKPIKSKSSVIDYYSSLPSTIITGYNEEELGILVLSDLHVGNKLADLSLAKYAYEYMSKNNIHISILLGDLVDGTFSKTAQESSNIEYQIYQFIDRYPFDEKIINFGILGDHDLSILESEGINFIDTIKNARSDIVINNYERDTINIKNDSLLLLHKYNKDLQRPSVTLEGHYHTYESKMSDNKLIIKAPSLSKINYSEANAIHLTLTFNKGYIEKVNVKGLKLGSKCELVKDVRYSFVISDEKLCEGIMNEDSICIRRLENKNSERINKFNKKYEL